MADVPHFAQPFYYVAGKPLVTEQDSQGEIRDCVRATMRTVIGFRDEAPDFGVTDPSFQILPVDTQTILTEILTSEPRADQLFDISQETNPFDQLVVKLVDEVLQSGAGVNE